MPRSKLTERVIAALPAPDPTGRQVIYWDAEMHGFGVQCSGTTNAKSYIVQRDLGGKARRKAFASVAEMPLAKAKATAAEMLVDLRNGIDPARKADANITLQAALVSYIDSRHDLRPESVRSYRGIERNLTVWLDRPLRDISADMVEKKHRELGSKVGEVTANVCMRSLRIVWNHASERIDLPPNPVRRLKRSWFKEVRRTRVLTEEQLPEFYRAVCGLQNEVARDLILLLMFCGFRRGEASKLRWQDIDFKQRTITLVAEHTKPGRALTVPMSDFVLDMLIARRALGKAEFVFVGGSQAGNINDLQGPLRAIAKQTGIRISPHDLRRTYATIAESIGTPITVLKRLLNHATGSDVTSGYVVLTTDRLREPVRDIATELERLCGIEKPAGDNVTKISIEAGLRPAARRGKAMTAW